MSTVSKKLRFTKRAIENLPANDATARSSDAEYTDAETPGLKLAVSKTGKKSFLFRYTHRGQKRSMKLGDFGAIDVEQARKLALQARGQLNQDVDPQESRDFQKVVPGFRDFAYNTYMPHSRNHKRSFKDDQSRLDAHMASYFGQKPLNIISGSDAQNYLYHLRDKCYLKPATINRHRSLLSAIFNHAVDLGVADENPCRKVKKQKENNARDRYLSDAELKRLNQVMDEKDPATGAHIEKNRVIVDLIRVLIVTGMRREEALGGKWADIDLAGMLWHLPTTKSGKSRYVPLNAQAVALLTTMEQHKASEWVFTNLKTGIRLINPDKGFKRLMARAGIQNMRIHDLRHTFASIAVSNGVTLYQVQNLLGHASAQTTQRYAHLCADSLRQASNMVGAHVAGTQGA